MGNPIIGTTNYPSMQTICNLARSVVQDDMAGATGTVGEGQVLVDNLAISVTLGNLFNSALRWLTREMRISENPTLIRDNYILLNMPVVNGPQGSAVPDPTVQVNLFFQGFFDGTQWWPNWVLPQDCIKVDEVQERQTNSNGAFFPMSQPGRSLAGINQGVLNGEWEWRQDGIWMRGTTQNADLRLRYQMRLPDIYQPSVDLNYTYVPVMQCEEAMAFRIAYLFAQRQGSAMLPEIKANMMAAMSALTNEDIKRAQGADYPVPQFGTESLTLM